MTERKYTESEMRARWRALYGDDKIPAALFEPFINGLTGPRLKPDCHVEDADGIGWTTSEWAMRGRAKLPLQPLVRADRVMEWAREWAEAWRKQDDHTLIAFFERRIREETEVSDD